MEQAQAVAFMIGTSAVVIGISLVFRWQAWAGWFGLLRMQGSSAAVMMGYLHLIIGTFIVGFHWKWQGLSLLLTLIGIKAIAEGFIYTLFPSCMMKMLAWYEPRLRIYLRFGGFITVIIGLLILGEWFQYMQKICVS